jgi:hypothetical protein
VPGINDMLARQIVSSVNKFREADLFKSPGIAESIDWGNAVLAMDNQALDEETIKSTLGVVLKYQDDVQLVKELIANQHLDG